MSPKFTHRRGRGVGTEVQAKTGNETIYRLEQSNICNLNKILERFTAVTKSSGTANRNPRSPTGNFIPKIGVVSLSMKL
jgi:hypothetical protein